MYFIDSVYSILALQWRKTLKVECGSEIVTLCLYKFSCVKIFLTSVFISCRFWWKRSWSCRTRGGGSQSYSEEAHRTARWRRLHAWFVPKGLFH